MFFKIGVLKNFSICTGKHLCWSLFLIKLVNIVNNFNEVNNNFNKNITLLKKRLQYKCLPVNIAKFLKTSFL